MTQQSSACVLEALEGRTFLSAAPNIIGTFKGFGYSSINGDQGKLTFVIKTQSKPDKRGVEDITGTETTVFDGKTFVNTLTGTL